MNEILILYCPLCGQGMFLRKDCRDKDFKCIDIDCTAWLRLIQKKDGSVELIEKEYRAN